MDYGALLPAVKAAILDACRSWQDGKTTGMAEMTVENKGPNDFLTSVDLAVNDSLCGALPKLLPDSRVVSEENPAPSVPDDPPRWIIDPIDGTNNLVYGLPFYAVSVGLVREGEGLLGAVYHPGTGELFSAASGSGAFMENVLIPGRSKRPIRVDGAEDLSRAIVMAETDPYFDRARNPSMDIIKAVYQTCVDCRITGSAAVDMSYIAAGRAHVHFCRNLNPWDYAGGSVILREAGGIASQWDGQALPYAGKHTSLAASNRAIHEAMLEILRRFL